METIGLVQRMPCKASAFRSTAGENWTNSEHAIGEDSKTDKLSDGDYEVQVEGRQIAFKGKTESSASGRSQNRVPPRNAELSSGPVYLFWPELLFLIAKEAVSATLAQTNSWLAPQNTVVPETEPLPTRPSRDI
jgi:hypothetical protein